MKKTRATLHQLLHHAVLAACAAAFSLPFLWMVSTSFKADDEIIHDPMIWIPELPERVRYSPWLDREAHPPRWNKPTALNEREWEALEGELRSALEVRATALFESPEWPHRKQPMEPSLFVLALSDVVDRIWLAIHPRIAPAVWKTDNRIERILGAVTLDDVVEAWRRLHRSLEIGEIRLRNSSSIDLGGEDAPEDPRIPYEAVGQERILIAEREIPFASEEETLDQIMVRIKGDASFHRLMVDLEWAGRKFKSDGPMVLDSGVYQDVFWKFTPQKRYDIEHLTFIPEESAPELVNSGEQTLRLKFYVEPSSYTRALWHRLGASYREVFFWVPYAAYMWVTLKLTFLNILGQLFACSLVAFAFARIRFPGRDLLFILMLSTMMLPPQVTMVPQFVLFSKMGTYNTLFPLYILSFAGAPFFIFLMRQFYLTLPEDLIEAAKIDGCNYFQIYWRIMLPLVKPALAAIAIFQFQATWNEFLQPLIYIADTDKTPISVGLFLFRQSHGGLTSGGGMWAELMAASTLMTLPVILLFFFTQRYFIQGVTLTGLKG